MHVHTVLNNTILKEIVSHFLSTQESFFKSLQNCPSKALFEKQTNKTMYEVLEGCPMTINHVHFLALVVTSVQQSLSVFEIYLFTVPSTVLQGNI